MTTLRQCWENCGTILRQLWDNVETTVGQLWENFGTTLRQLWDNFRLTLTQLRDKFNTILGQLWDHLGQLWKSFGPHSRGLYFLSSKIQVFIRTQYSGFEFFSECICSFYWKEWVFSKKPPFVTKTFSFRENVHMYVTIIQNVCFQPFARFLDQ